jgi:hypothetical protein
MQDGNTLLLTLAAKPGRLSHEFGVVTEAS